MSKFYSLLLGVDIPSAVPARTLSESDPSRTQPFVNILVIYCLLYKKQTINCQSPKVNIVNNRMMPKYWRECRLKRAPKSKKRAPKAPKAGDKRKTL